METAEPPQLLLLFIILSILFLLSMFFSSAETAFLSLNKLHIRFLCEQKNRAAQRAEKILQNKQKFLSTILIGNSIVNIAISATLTATAMQLFGDAGLPIAVSVGTILVLIFGEIVPKSLALVYHDAIAFTFAHIILFFMSVLSPVVVIFSAITNWLLLLCGIQPKKNKNALTESDLRDFFEASGEKGLIENEECSMLSNILRYGDFSARTVMTPRTAIVALQMDAQVPDIIELAQQSHFSRFPVYDTGIDSIQGFFYLKDLLVSSACARSNDFHIQKYLQKPLFVFENIKLADLEQQFAKANQNMAIVIDEYGGTAGLVTMADLNKEIFGPFADTSTADTATGCTAPPLEPPDFPAQKQPCIISAAMRLSDVNEQFNTHIVSEYHDTIGGYLMEAAGEIPACGFSIVIAPYRFTVHKTAAHKVDEVAVQLEAAAL
ncbi:MAG: hemolysin family protein [Treponema sp.]